MRLKMSAHLRMNTSVILQQENERYNELCKERCKAALTNIGARKRYM